MTNLEKIKYINEFDMLDSLNSQSELFAKDEETKIFLSPIDFEIKNKLKLYSYDDYQRYKDELHSDFKENLAELKKLVIKHCSPAVGKVLWIKYLITKIEKQDCEQ